MPADASNLIRDAWPDAQVEPAWQSPWEQASTAASPGPAGDGAIARIVITHVYHPGFSSSMPPVQRRFFGCQVAGVAG